jgi:hypothetical protein
LGIKSLSRASVEAAPTNYLFVQVESQQLDYTATSNASIQDSDCVHPDVNVDQLELERRNSAEYNFAQRMRENVVRSRDEWRVSTDPLRLLVDDGFPAGIASRIMAVISYQPSIRNRSR